MEKKNVLFTKDGMKVGVKEVNNEEYADRTQRYGLLFFSLSMFALYVIPSHDLRNTGVMLDP